MWVIADPATYTTVILLIVTPRVAARDFTLMRYL